MLTMGVLLLIVGMVAATDCTSYFTRVSDKRIKVTSEASSIDLTTSRLSDRLDSLYNTLDDMNSGENLSTISDLLNDVNDKKNNANDDFNSLNDAITSYDNTLTDSRTDLPAGCLTTFRVYDRDVSDMHDYFSNVKRYWLKFTNAYDSSIATYRGNLAGYTVSTVKPKVDSLRDSIGDVTSQIDGGIKFGINGSIVYNTTVYNQTECFGMVTTNVNLAIKDCSAKCNVAIGKATQNCTVNQPVCPKCQDCTSAVLGVQQSLNDCQSKLAGQNTQCPVCPAVVDTSAKDTQISMLNTQLSQTNTELNTASANLKDMTAKYNNATAQASKCTACENCLYYKVGCVLLILLIVAAWIIRM